MSRYSIIAAQNGQGYRVEVVGSDGARHTMLGFDTEAEAKGWIKADRRRERLRVPEPVHDAGTLLAALDAV